MKNQKNNFILKLKRDTHTFAVKNERIVEIDNKLSQFLGKHVTDLFDWLDENHLDEFKVERV